MRDQITYIPGQMKCVATGFGLGVALGVGCYYLWTTATRKEEEEDDRLPGSDADSEKRVRVFGIRCPRTGDGSSIKRIHLVRHAQGHHNVAGEANHDNYLKEEFIDSELTEFGKEQCAALAKECVENKIASNPELLVVSPMRRCLQTAIHSFPHHLGKIQWLAHELLREQTGSHPCDNRLSVTELKKQFGEHISFAGEGTAVDVHTTVNEKDGTLDVTHTLSKTTLEDPKYDKDPLYDLYPHPAREPNPNAIARGKLFLEWLTNRPEKEIIIVTHSAYLKNLFNGGAIVDAGREINALPFKWYENCEIRSYDIYIDYNHV